MRRGPLRKRAHIGGRKPKFIYFGGGTPSLLDSRDVAAIIRECRSAFDVSTNAEVTLEANPESAGQAVLDELDRALPGRGPLERRYAGFRKGFVIPTAKLDAVFPGFTAKDQLVAFHASGARAPRAAATGRSAATTAPARTAPRTPEP